MDDPELTIRSWLSYERKLVCRSINATAKHFGKSVRSCLQQFLGATLLIIASVLVGKALNPAAEIISFKTIFVVGILSLLLQFLFEYIRAPWIFQNETHSRIPLYLRKRTGWLPLTEAAKAFYAQSNGEIKEQLKLEVLTNDRVQGEGPIAAAKLALLDAGSQQSCKLRGRLNKGIEPEEIPPMIIDSLVDQEADDSLTYSGNFTPHYHDVEVFVESLEDAREYYSQRFC